MDLDNILYATDQELNNYAEHVLLFVNNEDRKEALLDILVELRQKAFDLDRYEGVRSDRGPRPDTWHSEGSTREAEFCYSGIE